MSCDGTPVVASESIERYLTALAAWLSGPAQTRTAIVDEIRDGLLEAIEAHTRRGLAPTAAVEAAIEALGDPEVLGAAFAPELAASRARRTALGLLATGPVLGTLWLSALLTAGGIGWQPQAADAWTIGRGMLGLAIVGAVLAALLAVASTGRLTRWLSGSPRLAPTAAAIASMLAATVDLTALATLGAVAMTAAASFAWVPAVLAAAASLTRLMLAGGAARRCLCARTTLA